MPADSITFTGTAYSNTAPGSASDPGTVHSNTPPSSASSPGTSYDNTVPGGPGPFLELLFDSTHQNWTYGPGVGGVGSVTWNAGGWVDVAVSTGGTNQMTGTPTFTWSVARPVVVRFRAKASVATSITMIHLSEAGAPYTGDSLSVSLDVGTDWQEYAVLLPNPTKTGNPTARIYLQLVNAWTGTISVDDFRAYYAENFAGKLVNDADPSSMSNPGTVFSNTPPSSMTP